MSGFQADHALAATRGRPPTITGRTMGRILIIGRSDDQLCQLVEKDMRQQGRQVSFLAEDHLLPGLQIAWRPGELDLGTVGQGDWRIQLADIDAIFCRSFGVPVSAEDFETKDGQYVSAEWFALVMGWINQMNSTVINRLKPALWYKQRLAPADLLSIAPECGFRLPHTMVTTRAEDARAFCAASVAGADYSPMTQPARFPIHQPEDMERLMALGEYLPFQLVETLDGDTTNVLVIGDSVFRIEPDGDASDDVSPDLAAKCRCLAEVLGLTFFQLSTVHVRGEWFCQEVNRHPTLLECNARAQDRIAHQLTCLLLGDARQ
jgi:hypothetical protein